MCINHITICRGISAYFLHSIGDLCVFKILAHSEGREADLGHTIGDFARVRAYKTVDKNRIYGKWSAVKSVKCK